MANASAMDKIVLYSKVDSTKVSFKELSKVYGSTKVAVVKYDGADMILQTCELNSEFVTTENSNGFLRIGMEEDNARHAALVKALDMLVAKAQLQYPDVAIAPLFNKDRAPALTAYFMPQNGGIEIKLVSRGGDVAGTRMVSTYEELRRTMTESNAYKTKLLLKPKLTLTANQETGQSTGRIKLTAILIDVDIDTATASTRRDSKRHELTHFIDDADHDNDQHLVTVEGFDSANIVITDIIDPARALSQMQHVMIPRYRYPDGKEDEVRVQTRLMSLSDHKSNGFFLNGGLNDKGEEQDEDIILKLVLPKYGEDDISQLMGLFEERFTEDDFYSKLPDPNKASYNLNVLLSETSDGADNLLRLALDTETTRDRPRKITRVKTRFFITRNGVTSEHKTEDFGSVDEYFRFMRTAINRCKNGAQLRLVIAIKKVWIGKSKKNRKYEYGIRFKLSMIQVVDDGTSTDRAVNNIDYDFVVDDEDEEEPVAGTTSGSPEEQVVAKKTRKAKA